MEQKLIFEKLQQAVSLHQLGELDDADEIYRELLSVDPDNFHALHFSGCIQRQKKDMKRQYFF